MPTALDRVQVLLQPEEYAELNMLAKDERRKLSSMAAVLINEAIRHRIQAGTFTPSPDDPAYGIAKNRVVAREMGKKVEAEEKGRDDLKAVMEEYGAKTVMKKTEPKIEDVLTVKGKKRVTSSS